MPSCDLDALSHRAKKKRRGDSAFHGAWARFGGRRGCDEVVRFEARMFGLPLTSPSSPRCDLRCFKRPRANRENQDRPCDAFVKRRHRESTRDAFLRNATKRRHSRKSVDVPSFERGTPVLAVERSADFAAGVRFICRSSFDRAQTLPCDFAWVDCRTSSCPLPKGVPSFEFFELVMADGGFLKRRRLFRDLQHDMNDARANPATF